MINKILSACDFKILTQFSPSLVSDVIQTCCLLSLARSTSCLQGWCHTASWILRGHSHGFTCWILQECQAHTQAQVQVCDHAFVWLHVHSGGQGHVYVWVHAMLFLRSMSVSEPMPIPLPPASHLCPHLSLCPCPCPLGGGGRQRQRQRRGGSDMNSPSPQVLHCSPHELGAAERLLLGFSALDYTSRLQFPGCIVGPCMHLCITCSCSAFLLIMDSVFKDSLMHTQII